VQPALKAIGMQPDFWRIAMRPGKPLMVGSLGAMHVLGLPGNPVSSMVCALLFLEPLIARLAHRPMPSRRRTAITTTALPGNDHRQDYLRATAGRDAGGVLSVTSFGKQDSSQMKVFALSDALIIRPPNAPGLPAGAECDVMLLRDI
jgi:molybdopterin molybdotransferase